ncbi:hypothetical protein [Zeimonas arvi]|uniref:Uncharacterized protein n=1 Tax=Zeimonas arvi TaxID=2498847 RepID=A0A5C8NRZ6_9BURK|nr:hypothetical protein [Zeimonas arvi]TXL63907.1 hypothetical protein FHP08_16580 [Zeimonas arvi]
MSTISPGTLCLTCNCSDPRNNGKLVLVVFIDPHRAETPYLIERVDGLRFASAMGRDGEPMQRSPGPRLWAARRKLKPIDDQELTPLDVCELEVAG